MPIWIKEKLFQKKLLFNKLKLHDKNYEFKLSEHDGIYSQHHKYLNGVK